MNLTETDKIVEFLADRVVNCSVIDINGQMSKRIHRCYFEEDLKEAIRLTKENEMENRKKIFDEIEGGEWISGNAIRENLNPSSFEGYYTEKNIFKTKKKWLGEGAQKQASGIVQTAGDDEKCYCVSCKDVIREGRGMQ